MGKDLYGTIHSILSRSPKIDVHTHVTADRLMARGLDDVILYHMVNSELYAAGSGIGERVPEDRSDKEALRRLEAAVPLIPKIRNTSLWWAVRLILHDLYGWKEEITEDNWRKLHALIGERNRDDARRAREVVKSLNIRKIGTEMWRGGDGRADDLLEYALEWAFFARAQWGQPDIALFELERAWNAEAPQPTIPVTMRLEDRPALSRMVKSPDGIREAVAHYCGKIPHRRILATTQHFSTEIRYRKPTDDETEKAIKNRDNAGQEERDIYASAIMHAFLAELERQRKRTVFQFSIGAEALPYESGAFLSQRTIKEIAEFVVMYSGVKFMCFNASRHGHHSLCTLVRELPNFSLAGFWWHGFFPGALAQMAEERLDMAPMNRQCDYLTDAYCVDWIYGKNALILSAYARVLAEKVRTGQFGMDDIGAIARGIFYDSARELLSFEAR